MFISLTAFGPQVLDGFALVRLVRYREASFYEGAGRSTKRKSRQ